MDNNAITFYNIIMITCAALGVNDRNTMVWANYIPWMITGSCLFLFDKVDK